MSEKSEAVEIKGRFEQGQQPCDNFTPEEGYTRMGYTHQCYRCGTGTVVFCTNCSRDHHEWGYDTCEALPDWKGDVDE